MTRLEAFLSDVDVPLERAPREVHLAGVAFRKCSGVVPRTDPNHELVSHDSAAGVFINEKGQASKHTFFGDASLGSERRPDGVGQPFVVGHLQRVGTYLASPPIRR